MIAARQKSGSERRRSQTAATVCRHAAKEVRSQTNMDVARPDLARRKKRRRLLFIISALLALAVITMALSRLKPAAPSVEKSAIWTDVVKRGEMLRQVRGNGTLVPEQIQFVQSETDGRVERIFIKPGAEVTADT